MPREMFCNCNAWSPRRCCCPAQFRGLAPSHAVPTYSAVNCVREPTSVTLASQQAAAKHTATRALPLPLGARHAARAQRRARPRSPSSWQCPHHSSSSVAAALSSMRGGLRGLAGGEGLRPRGGLLLLPLPDAWPQQQCLHALPLAAQRALAFADARTAAALPRPPTPMGKALPLNLGSIRLNMGAFLSMSGTMMKRMRLRGGVGRGRGGHERLACMHARAACQPPWPAPAPHEDVVQLRHAPVSPRGRHVLQLAVPVVLGVEQLPPVHLPALQLHRHHVALSLVHELDGDPGGAGGAGGQRGRGCAHERAWRRSAGPPPIPATARAAAGPHAAEGARATHPMPFWDVPMAAGAGAQAQQAARRRVRSSRPRVLGWAGLC